MRGLSCAFVDRRDGDECDAHGSRSSDLSKSLPNLPFSAAVKADGLIYVAGQIVPQGDIRAQTKAVIESMSQVLQKAGSSLANVASVHVYLTKAEDFAAMNEVYRTFWVKDPPVRTTIVSDLVLAGGLVEMAMVAVPNGGERVVIHPSDWTKSPNPYSYGIRVGRHPVSRRPRVAQRQGQLGRRRRHGEADRDGPRQRRPDPEGGGHVVRQRRVVARVHHRQHQVPGDEQGLHDLLHEGSAGARDGRRPADGTAVSVVEISLTASRLPKQAFTTPAADGTPGKPSPILSSAIKTGNRLYVSGILGNNADNKGNTEAQTVEIMNRVGRTLKAAGYDWADVVDGIVYITDVKNFDAMNKGYRTIFSKDFPSRATVRTGLVNADGLVEIMFVAAK